MDELKVRIAELEVKLQRKDEEIRAKEQSFADALSREQVKNREREQKESAKREELNKKVLVLTEEKAELKSRCDSLAEQEEERKKAEDELIRLRKEIGVQRVKFQEQKQNLEELALERRKSADNAQHELADLRCQLSIMAHKLEHAVTKQVQHDNQAEEVAEAQLKIRTLEERLEDAERSAQTEAARHIRDRRQLEERLQKAYSELQQEREGPTRVEISERFQNELLAKKALLLKALQLSARTGGPLVPLSADHDDVVEQYLTKLARFLAEDTSSPTAAAANNNNNNGSPNRSRSRPQHADESPLERQLLDALHRLPADRQQVLLRRYIDSAESNVANSHRFLDRSAYPPPTEDPVVLVNHIAAVTAERDALAAKLEDLPKRSSPAKVQSASAVTEAAAVVAADSPPARPKAEEQGQQQPVSPSPNRMGSAGRKNVGRRHWH